MLIINQIKLNIDIEPDKVYEKLYDKVSSELRINKKDINSLRIVKKSIDARKNDIKYVFSVEVAVNNEKQILKKNKKNTVMLSNIKKYSYNFNKNDLNFRKRPVIIGCGPAGLFCAYMLAVNGVKPVVIERGDMVERRIEKVNNFWKNNELDCDSNVQFGEGGAGTFSDGKLNTMVKDTYGRIRKVLEIFVEFGADEDILYINKPHIGTDKLVDIVKNMREEIINLGGEFLFNSKMTDITIKDGKVKSVTINNSDTIETDNLVLAIGHSARDTFELLNNKGFDMSAKSFAIGLRIEHSRDLISKAMYGEAYDKLPAADYKFTHQASNGRGVYTFCMCPGGFVVNASSEKEMLVVNGMSNHDRDEMNSNSAIIATVNPQDFDSDDVLSGVEFQRKWEKAAYKAGKGCVPVQLYGDFVNNRKSTELGLVKPNIKGEYNLADLNEALPEYVSQAIKEAVSAFDKKINGYADNDAVLSGVETRTSSPVRINRDDNYMSNYLGIYPCGEGAGYAGGITSAAVDGIKVFEAIIKCELQKDML